ncbi:MAG: GH3 auxin-responsive promoter family protein [Flavobacteriia bacterium]|nr:GH3 auxin-responsive promoter family protein [Flavobacteriia bacterium]
MAIDAIFSWYIEKRIHRIANYRNNPLFCQEDVLSTLITKAGNTSFGNHHRFEKISSYEDFSASVPIQDYTTLKPFIERSIAGELDVVWPGKTDSFAKSSGTTGDRVKILPVTMDSLNENHFAGGKDLLANYYLNHPSRKLYSKKHLVIGGSADLTQKNANGFVGDLSAIIVKNLPWWTEYRRTPSVEIALNPDWESKLEEMAKATISENIGIITGVPSWTLLLIKRVLELSGKSNLHDVWPNLELYMHGGMNFAPYEKEFKKLIPSQNMNYVDSYNSSEGFFGMQDQLNSKELLLMTDSGVFFEFIPMDSFDGINSKVIVPLGEVDINTEYALVISTSAGLWRYIIGDTLRFVSTSPFRFIISGRTTHFINCFGEKMIVQHAESALTDICHQLNAQINDFTVGPYFNESGSNGGHEWFIEFDREPKFLDEFEIALDMALKKYNSDYEAKRFKNINIGIPKFNYLKKGSFEQWLKSKGKLGGQHKVPRLLNERTILDEIQELNK